MPKRKATNPDDETALIATQAHKTVVILDYGSQYTQLIARRIREANIYSLILPGTVPLEKISELNPCAIILSGGPSSVYEEGAPQIPKGLLEYREKNNLPLLGICYGMHLLMHDLGAVESGAAGKGSEYGRAELDVLDHSGVFSKIDGDKKTTVWMSHGDETKQVPGEGWVVTARTSAGVIAAVENKAKRMFAIQFHPEVTHSLRGTDILRGFLNNMAGLTGDWKMASIVDEQIEIIKAKVGPNAHAICALSGGVDSAVAATLVHKALGDRLHCVFVDNGLLRYDERNRVMTMFKDHLHLPVTCFDAVDRFLGKLEGVSDPERKRKIIGNEFIEVFDEASNNISKEIGHRPEFLVQGTLYPDVIESCPPPGRGGHSVTIKSHHNVGGLPEHMNFQLVEPLRNLFKDEVRTMGKVLNVPTTFLARHPFPGPGLAVRILGEITRDRLEVLRQVDEVYINALKEDGLYDEIWQAFAVFLPVKSVGVQGDGRTHSHVVALRAVVSRDGMTADWYHFDPQFLAKVSTKICNQVKNVNRVCYDITSKPPSTIEWE